jgi:NADH-ubiquinone oxidoreductase chain 6
MQNLNLNLTFFQITRLDYFFYLLKDFNLFLYFLVFITFSLIIFFNLKAITDFYTLLTSHEIDDTDRPPTNYDNIGPLISEPTRNEAYINRWESLFLFIILPMLLVYYLPLLPSLLLNVLINFYQVLLLIVSNFYSLVLPTTLIILSSSIILFKNPMYSLLSLTAVFLIMGGVLIGHTIEFFSIIFLIVYIGAISILFLFVIMMFNLKKLVDTAVPYYLYIARWFSTLVISKFFCIVVSSIYFWLTITIKNNQFMQTIIDSPPFDLYYISSSELFKDTSFVINLKYMQDALVISDVFYTDFSIKFILIAFILLTSMIGALVMCVSFHTWVHWDILGPLQDLPPSTIPILVLLGTPRLVEHFKDTVTSAKGDLFTLRNVIVGTVLWITFKLFVESVLDLRDQIVLLIVITLEKAGEIIVDIIKACT